MIKKYFGVKKSTILKNLIFLIFWSRYEIFLNLISLKLLKIVIYKCEMMWSLCLHVAMWGDAYGHHVACTWVINVSVEYH